MFGLLDSTISNLQGNTIEYPNPINNPLLGTGLYLTFIVAGIAFNYSLVAVVKSKERAILVYLILLISACFNILFTPYGLPILTFPFVLTVWLFLVAKKELVKI